MIAKRPSHPISNGFAFLVLPTLTSRCGPSLVQNRDMNAEYRQASPSPRGGQNVVGYIAMRKVCPVPFKRPPV